MKSEYIRTRSAKKVVNNKQVLEYTYQRMTLEEVKNARPKSRLESFLRRKALEEKRSDLSSTLSS